MRKIRGQHGILEVDVVDAVVFSQTDQLSLTRSVYTGREGSCKKTLTTTIKLQAVKIKGRSGMNDAPDMVTNPNPKTQL